MTDLEADHPFNTRGAEYIEKDMMENLFTRHEDLWRA